MKKSFVLFGLASVLLILVGFGSLAQVTLTSMDVEYCLKNTHTKWRITNDTGQTIEYMWEAYVTGYPTGTGTVGPEHTTAARFTNPYYFYVPYPHPVTVKLQWRYPGETQWRFGGVKASGGLVLPPRDPPTITCPSDITVLNDPGKAGAVVSWQLQFTGDACTCTPPSGSFFPIGKTRVTCTATNYSPIGTVCQQASCSFDVTVNANWPGIGMSGCVCWDGKYRLSVYNGGGPGYIGYDVYGKPNSFVNLGWFNSGETKVVYLDVGNESWTIRKMASLDGVNWIYKDGTHTANRSKPSSMWCWNIIGCPGDVSGVYGTPVTWTEPVVYCPCSGSTIPATSQTHRPGALFPVGTTTVTYTWTSPVTDHTRTCSFNVVVAKKTLLVIAEDKVKTYDGESFTDFTVRYEGFVPGEGPADLGGALVFSGSAVGAVDEGVYEIIPGGLTSPNYDIVFVPGTLTILPYYTIGPAGGAGAFVDKAVAGGAGAYQGRVVDAIYNVGEPIVVSAEVLDFYGRPVTGSCGWVTLVQLIEGGRQIVWYYSTMNYNPETGLQEVSIPTVPVDGEPRWYPSTGLPVGYYKVLIDFKNGSHEEILIQLVTE